MSSPTVADLRGFLQGKLPEYMVPATFVFLEALPLTPNGKLDQPGPAGSRPPARRARLRGRGRRRRRRLANLWAEGYSAWSRVGVQDNFFELGGHSLLATQVAARVRVAYPGIDLPLRLLFEQPTVAALGAGSRAARAVA